MNSLFLNSGDLRSLLSKLMSDQAKLYAPIKEFDRPHLNLITEKNIDKIDLSGYRTIESLKALFFKVSQPVAQVFGPGLTPSTPSYVILGARACDLSALSTMDHVLSQGDFDDTFYTNNRKNTLIITEKPGLAKQGSGINFVIENNKQKFEMNKTNIEK